MQISADDARLLPVAQRHELIAAGFSDRALAAAVAHGTMARPRRGAYVDGPSWRFLGAEQRYAVICRAAYLQAHTEVVLSHTSALPFYDAPLWGFDLSEVHLTRSDSFAGRRESGVRRHSGVLLPGDVIDVHGHSVMSPCRTALEVSLLGSSEAALVTANYFLHAGAFAVEDLRARYAGSIEYWPDSLATSIVLRLADARVESVGESRTLHFFYRHGLPAPEPQYRVSDGGEEIARLDFALPDLGCWFEFDGRSKYEKYLRQGETAADAVIREKRRESVVQEITGWRCFRIMWSDLADPGSLEHRIRRFLGVVKAERVRRRPA